MPSNKQNSLLLYISPILWRTLANKSSMNFLFLWFLLFEQGDSMRLSSIKFIMKDQIQTQNSQYFFWILPSNHVYVMTLIIIAEFWPIITENWFEFMISWRFHVPTNLPSEWVLLSIYRRFTFSDIILVFLIDNSSVLLDAWMNVFDLPIQCSDMI